APSAPIAPRARRAPSARPRSRQPAAGGGEIQQRSGQHLCETSSWRLLLCEALASGLVTTRVSRAATEPPLQFSTAIGTSPQIETCPSKGANQDLTPKRSSRDLAPGLRRRRPQMPDRAQQDQPAHHEHG